MVEDGMNMSGLPTSGPHSRKPQLPDPVVANNVTPNTFIPYALRCDFQWWGKGKTRNADAYFHLL